MSFLTVSTVKNSHILAGVYFIFLKDRARPNSKALVNQIWTSKKRSKKHFFAFSTFYNLVALILDENCVKGCRVTAIVKVIQFERAWGELGARSRLQRQPRTKYLRKAPVFM